MSSYGLEAYSTLNLSPPTDHHHVTSGKYRYRIPSEEYFWFSLFEILGQGHHFQVLFDEANRLKGDMVSQPVM